MDDILTKAQKASAKKMLLEQTQRELRNEIWKEASRIARKIVRENRASIEKQVRSQFVRELSKVIKDLMKEAASRSHVYLDM